MFATAMMMSGAAGGDSDDYSATFNGSDEYMYRPSTEAATSTTIWTFSTWFKRGSTGTTMNFMGSDNGSSNQFGIQINSSNKVRTLNYVSSSFQTHYITTDTVTDTSGWHHLLVVQNGSSNHDIYIDGVEASYDTSVGPNGTAWVHTGTSRQVAIGAETLTLGAVPFDGELAYVAYIDGTAYTVGDFVSSGAPIKDLSGLTFGNQGFYLTYEDSASMGDETSGNANDLTLGNMDSSNQNTYSSGTISY